MMNWSRSAKQAEGVVVTVPDQATMLNTISDRFASGEGFTIATLNLDHVVKLARDPDFAQAYSEHTYITADGNPIVWLSRLAGQSDVALVPGSELIDPVAALANEAGVKVALFGATTASLQAAADALAAKHKGLEIAFVQAPKMGFDPTGEDADAAIAAIGESGARLAFLALGAPKQEIFAARAQTKLPQVGFLSIGAGLDFVSGAQKRAPKIVQKLALEWLWRLVGQPKRLFARYASCFGVLPRMFARALATRRSVN